MLNLDHSSVIIESAETARDCIKDTVAYCRNATRGPSRMTAVLLSSAATLAETAAKETARMASYLRAEADHAIREETKESK